ncbi:glycoside hydrolase family 131 protein [Patellaria atrata CBS 101060]|uniref:Glycoside hydrolase family 131 protein n=1 Tax=Patellaria atrata CBS 101060 TaxID=1346257 RepID=A0A9P4SC88_9PEZI|nr:glycoside hydrolase family 131 protein [Patellaria atrata CBS 101060]
MLFLLLPAVTSALPSSAPFPIPRAVAACPTIASALLPNNYSLSSFDSPRLFPFSSLSVKASDQKWSQILDFPPSYPYSRFDGREFKGVTVSINDSSVVKRSDKVEMVKRAGLVVEVLENRRGKGRMAFHWSVQQDLTKMLNLTHEYVNVWYGGLGVEDEEMAWSVRQGWVLGSGETGGTKERRERWHVLNAKGEEVWGQEIMWRGWQNFAVTMDFDMNTLQIFYSVGEAPLVPVTSVTLNKNTVSNGHFQLGIAKKPTETKTGIFDGYQEHLTRKEAQTFGGIFVEDNTRDCISL